MHLVKSSMLVDLAAVHNRSSSPLPQLPLILKLLWRCQTHELCYDSGNNVLNDNLSPYKKLVNKEVRINIFLYI